MSAKGFTHLHLHSQYSLLDGAVNFDKLFKQCKKLSMDSVAVTDHGNMYGACEFYFAAREAGIAPIIGCEAYVAKGSRKEKNDRKEAAQRRIEKEEARVAKKEQDRFCNALRRKKNGYCDPAG